MPKVLITVRRVQEYQKEIVVNDEEYFALQGDGKTDLVGRMIRDMQLFPEKVTTEEDYSVDNLETGEHIVSFDDE